MTAQKPNIIARRIDEMGATLTSIAEQVGVTKQAVALWANGTNAPNGRHFAKLAAVLGVTAEALAREFAE